MLLKPIVCAVSWSITDNGSGSGEDAQNNIRDSSHLFQNTNNWAL